MDHEIERRRVASGSLSRRELVAGIAGGGVLLLSGMTVALAPDGATAVLQGAQGSSGMRKAYRYSLHWDKPYLDVSGVATPLRASRPLGVAGGAHGMSETDWRWRHPFG